MPFELTVKPLSRRTQGTLCVRRVRHSRGQSQAREQNTGGELHVDELERTVGITRNDEMQQWTKRRTEVSEAEHSYRPGGSAGILIGSSYILALSAQLQVA